MSEFFFARSTREEINPDVNRSSGNRGAKTEGEGRKCYCSRVDDSSENKNPPVVLQYRKNTRERKEMA